MYIKYDVQAEKTIRIFFSLSNYQQDAQFYELLIEDSGRRHSSAFGSEAPEQVNPGLERDEGV